jgi:hypothetical protein
MIKKVVIKDLILSALTVLILVGLHCQRQGATLNHQSKRANPTGYWHLASAFRQRQPRNKPLYQLGFVCFFDFYFWIRVK